MLETDWNKLRIFYHVAQHRNFTEAAEILGLSQSSASRQIGALEEQMGVALFHRHARGVELSEQGEVVFRAVASMMQQLQSAEDIIGESTDKPKGSLTVTTPEALGTIWLTPLMKEFQQHYPDIHIKLLCFDRDLDLSKREADIAIRLHPSKSPDLVQKPIITLRNSIYASNDYLREYGIPKKLEDLRQHRIVAYGDIRTSHSSEFNWLLQKTKHLKLKPVFQINSLFGMRTAIKNGMGVAALPDYIMYRARHISRVLDDVEGPTTEAYFVYPLELKNSKRLSVFRNFLMRKVAEYNF